MTLPDALPLAPRAELKDALAHAGFSIGALVDLTAPDFLSADLAAYDAWLASGAHAGMDFMGRNREARADAERILPGARTALVVLVPYATGERVRRGRSADGNPRDPSPPETTTLPARTSGRTPAIESLVARYARGKDYHKIIKKHLSKALTAFARAAGVDQAHRVVVDAIPFFDRAHGRASGLGFVGKNTMLIRPGVGSYFFIATVLLTAPPAVFGVAPARPDPVSRLDCGDCRRCLDACPTGALPRPRFLDANKCLSYLSIEHRGTVADEYLHHFSDTIYGCDICQSVCPYNFATLDLVAHAEFRDTHAPLLSVNARDVAAMSEADYERWFGGTAMTRAKYSGLVRNALYHLYAIGDPVLAGILAAREMDPDPLVASTVAQLIGRVRRSPRAPA